eukprot:scaffold120028_cov18-Tisochrysis_lutea.AAC.1
MVFAADVVAAAAAAAFQTFDQHRLPDIGMPQRPAHTAEKITSAGDGMTKFSLLFVEHTGQHPGFPISGMHHTSEGTDSCSFECLKPQEGSTFDYVPFKLLCAHLEIRIDRAAGFKQEGATARQALDTYAAAQQ